MVYSIALITRCVTMMMTASVSLTLSDIYQPGMQPNENGIEFAKFQPCRMCHADTNNGVADPVHSWQGGMMAQAMRDPVFLAALAIDNQDIKGSGEFCLRCHAPRGWLEGRSTPADGSALNREDRYGVTCDVCHRLMDPMSAEAKGLVQAHAPESGQRHDGSGPGQSGARPLC